MQGFGKFGFYEIFKDVYKFAVGDENAAKYKTIGWALSSASAEVIADVLLCPMEAVSILFFLFSSLLMTIISTILIKCKI
jgi:solute carrier family 25 phosphate transporter 3